MSGSPLWLSILLDFWSSCFPYELSICKYSLWRLLRGKDVFFGVTFLVLLCSFINSKHSLRRTFQKYKLFHKHTFDLLYFPNSNRVLKSILYENDEKQEIQSWFSLIKFLIHFRLKLSLVLHNISQCHYQGTPIFIVFLHISLVERVSIFPLRFNFTKSHFYCYVFCLLRLLPTKIAQK